MLDLPCSSVWKVREVQEDLGVGQVQDRLQ